MSCGYTDVAAAPTFPSASDLCEPVPAGSLPRGSLVVARRGGCPFSLKAIHAQDGGAAGVMIVNHEGGLLRMPAEVAHTDNVTIPVVMLRNSTGG